ncbi:MAG: 4'-phosphopantetheinyl transferase family protein, partial [Ignavibacterium sp.]
MFQNLESEIHIHTINFSTERNSVENYFQFISEDEKGKVNRFKFSVNRQNSIITYYFRRKILSQYLIIEPSEIEFSYNAYGKPLISEPQRSGIHFNYSHSDDFLIFAVSKNIEVGIDIELVKDLPDLIDLAKNYFSDSEFQHFHSLENKIDRINFFYKIWTRKEALLKAAGIGITDDLKSINLMTENNLNRLAEKIDFM